MVDDVIEFFEGRDIPDIVVNIEFDGMPVNVSLKKMVVGHLAMIKHNKYNTTFKPYLDRLITVKALLE